ncbi:nuclear transport factor 2 family protein [Maritimibacter sp. DP1N21-5]|uniref:nuclear transport factor 2 family protein n=1 Tax=Maritimibacter sp. DP1N21-5 TaxID=2836867 RepID=UPI001C474150|nr:nuclear transport factor 2 family protein [Maritimibacter sp. DP1N21-5]MBV7407431.1 nuclear transport factor 2 family protein [Maritimibacter sp. DP1N21-5]
MSDENDIRRRIELYCDAVNRRGGAAWIDCWWPDALWTIYDRRIEGAQEILTTWEGAMAGYSQIHFFAQVGTMDIDGDRARLRVYTTEYLTTIEGAQRLQVGEYDDLMDKRDGHWRFAHRAYRVREQRHVPSGERG